MIKNDIFRLYLLYGCLLGLGIIPTIKLHGARTNTKKNAHSIELQKLESNANKSVSQELKILNKAFGTPKGFDNLKNTTLTLDYMHVFGIHFDCKNNKSMTLHGFHHDHQNKIEKTGIIRFSIKRKNKHGYYRAALLYQGKHLGTKNFFPAQWTRAKVVSKIREAYNNRLKQESKINKRSDGSFEIVGTTQEGIPIKMFINNQGTIFTAYPAKI